MKLTSARQAIHDAYAIHLTSKGFEASFRAEAKKPDFTTYLQAAHRCRDEVRKEKLGEFSPVGFYTEDKILRENNNRQVCDAVEAGMIIAAVEGLPEPFRSWAKWAYGPRTEDTLPEQGRFFRWLDQDVTDNFDGIERVYRKATKEKIRDVVAYAILDYRSYSVNDRHLYPVNLIINRIGIQRQNWKRDFEPWHAYYWRVCDHYLDKTALPTVASVVLRLKFGRDELANNEHKLNKTC